MQLKAADGPCLLKRPSLKGVVHKFNGFCSACRRHCMQAGRRMADRRHLSDMAQRLPDGCMWNRMNLLELSSAMMITSYLVCQSSSLCQTNPESRSSCWKMSFRSFERERVAASKFAACHLQACRQLQVRLDKNPGQSSGCHGQSAFSELCQGHHCRMLSCSSRCHSAQQSGQSSRLLYDGGDMKISGSSGRNSTDAAAALTSRRMLSLCVRNGIAKKFKTRTGNKKIWNKCLQTRSEGISKILGR